MIGRRTCVLLVLALLRLQEVFAAGAIDHRMIAAAAPQPEESTGPASREALESFVDGFMASRLRTGAIAGAVVAVVKDDTLFFAKGYGYADIDKSQRVDAQRTLFRPGSISKLFVWTAVMQLVERGQLDLDADVNGYLADFKIPATYPQPITLRNLMTHSSGLEDLTYFFPDPGGKTLPMGQWLARHVPARVRPPATDFSSGTQAAYSNWGAVLAAYIVAVRSGTSFEEYVERNIFAPLAMNAATFREPLPPALAASVSNGYERMNGAFEPQPFEVIRPYGPAGGLSATATDMARFMLAYLNEGELQGARILAPRSVHAMLTRTLSPDPAVNGLALGFYETWTNAHRVVGHGGDTRFFHSVLSLLPEHKTGIFVSTNTSGPGAWASEELARAFIQQYFPARLPSVLPPADAGARNQRYVGRYRTQSRSQTSYESFLTALDDLIVTAQPDGTLLFDDPLDGREARWAEVGDGVFRRIDDDVFVAFKGDDGGRATHLVGPFAPTAYERVQWYETFRFHAAVAGVCLLVFVTVLVGAYRRRHQQGGGVLRWAVPMLSMACALLVVASIGGFAALSTLDAPNLLRVSLTLAVLAVVPVLGAIMFLVLAWRARAWQQRTRWYYALATLAALVFLYELHYWNLFGYRFG
jgi:CubicO group peptidase (beta-lactamase class C family)